MATKKSDESSTSREVYEGQPALPADDPTFHKEEWPEAYDNPHVKEAKDKKDAPAADSGTSSSSSGS